MPTFDNVQVTGNQTIDGDLQVNRNLTIFGDFQVNGNETIFGDFQVNNNETIFGDFQVNGDESLVGHLGVNGEITGGGTIKVGTRLISLAQATVPAIAPSIQTVRFFSVGISNQPGLILKGTDGNDYVLFIDLTGGTPHIGIHLA
mgnify:CR=1 FL=1